ncbi:MAG: hypothetical protein M3Y62_05380 [Candidatus Dormibacteraeota bacterium]|uniref:hypothetical protein n=1 Tax=Candidatus Dormibacter sp. TaxID=2973982 RepID=UPI000DB44CFD|nr:hypothetical protein [Candidatus Dormibacteraeota bacterium]PZR68920.1 MAG: hypothetical protein DLM66_07745 [Candidatus Dormibacteraeota bacterium]
MSESNSGGGFSFGFLLGLVVGAGGAIYLATGPAREQVTELRQRTIELSGTAREAAVDPESPVRRAIADGVAAARRRRQELEQAAATAKGSTETAGQRELGGDIQGTVSDA